MVKSQIGRRFADTTILATETIPQKDIEACKGGITRGRNIFFQRDHAGQAHGKTGGMHFAVIFGQDADAAHKHRFDSVLP